MFYILHYIIINFCTLSHENKPEKILLDGLLSCSMTSRTFEPHIKRKHARQSVIDLKVTTVLDQANQSDRMITLITITNFIHSLSNNIDNFIISLSFIKKFHKCMHNFRTKTL